MSQNKATLLLDELEKLELLRSELSSGCRRRDTRFVVRGDARLIVLDRHHNHDAPSEVMLRDISRCGVGFLADRSLNVGSICRLRFVQQNYGIGEADVIVRYTREIEKHVNIIGCQISMKCGLMYLTGVEPASIDSAFADILTSDTFVAPEDIQ